MIPKVIHYCWFGGKPLNEMSIKCIESWRKFCPEYEIVEWNENNFNINCCDYVKDAYEAEKWAFVSDYARFEILYNYGGIYFDTDVELIKPIEEILKKGPFMGCEKVKHKSECRVAAGLGIAAEPYNEIYGEILIQYQNDTFYTSDGTINYDNVVSRVTRILKNKGLQDISEIQEIGGIYIYPPEYFCPLDGNTGELNVTNNTISIHHYTASWMNSTNKKIAEIRDKYSDKGVLGLVIGKVIIFPYKIISRIQRIFGKI